MAVAAVTRPANGESSILDWVDTWNENPKPFIWHKTADDILERLGDHCTAVLGTELATETT